MIALLTAAIFGGYIFLCMGIVALVKKYGHGKKKYKVLAIIMCVLIPTWDLPLGAMVYFPACLIVPKVAVYETAETDGIYYEGKYDYIYEAKNVSKDTPVSQRFRVGTVDDLFKRGFQFRESKITKRQNGFFDYTPVVPAHYRCTFLSEDERSPYLVPMDCVEVARLESRYMVRVTKK